MASAVTAMANVVDFMIGPPEKDLRLRMFDFFRCGCFRSGSPILYYTE